MKNSLDSRIGRVFSRIFNIRSWFDWERMKSFSLFVSHVFTRVFSIDQEKEAANKAKATASFKMAQKQQNLSDKQLLVQQKALFRLSMLMVLIAVGILTYSIYHFFYGFWKAGAVSLIITMLSLTLAFRYHFWYFQIKNKKLGCTPQEWFRKGLLGEKE